MCRSIKVTHKEIGRTIPCPLHADGAQPEIARGDAGAGLDRASASEGHRLESSRARQSRTVSLQDLGGRLACHVARGRSHRLVRGLGRLPEDEENTSAAADAPIGSLGSRKCDRRERQRHEYRRALIAYALDAHFGADEVRLLANADDAEVVGQHGFGVESRSIILDQQLQVGAARNSQPRRSRASPSRASRCCARPRARSARKPRRARRRIGRLPLRR